MTLEKIEDSSFLEESISFNYKQKILASYKICVQNISAKNKKTLHTVIL